MFNNCNQEVRGQKSSPFFEKRTSQKLQPSYQAAKLYMKVIVFKAFVFWPIIRGLFSLSQIGCICLCFPQKLCIYLITFNGHHMYTDMCRQLPWLNKIKKQMISSDSIEPSVVIPVSGLSVFSGVFDEAFKQSGEGVRVFFALNF